MSEEKIEKPNYKKAENDAIRLLQEFHYQEPPVDPISIAKQIGIDIKIVTFDRSDVSGMYDYEKRIIYVNDNQLPTRKLVIVAHEVGHVIMHDNYKILLRSSHDRDPIELESDAFAANLMMPKFMIDKLQNLTTSAELARIFAVSQAAIKNRIGFFNKFKPKYEQ